MTVFTVYTLVKRFMTMRYLYMYYYTYYNIYNLYPYRDIYRTSIIDAQLFIVRIPVITRLHNFGVFVVIDVRISTVYHDMR